jgi:2-methylisocitrate lyase-like PEP mutase family enzyme
LERAGASAIQLEDQHAPKRCGHFAGKELIPAVEMVGKVRAAADARREGMVIIARTDACAVEGFQAAIDRARRYIEAGADMTFVEAPENLDDLQAVPKRLAAPQLLNMVLGGKTPIIDAAEATRIGFAFVLYANAALQGAILGMENALKVLRDLIVARLAIGGGSKMRLTRRLRHRGHIIRSRKPEATYCGLAYAPASRGSPRPGDGISPLSGCIRGS